ncbi:MAG TPA: hypothetical protein VFN48_11680 [Solirubrobacteraceae bacterium]|nr:hypothetical protein [Solirubrobacteraceae bacterium]
MPFHVELKDGRETVRVFNLGEDEVQTQFIGPLRAGVTFAFGDKRFEPLKARLVVIEGDHLAPGQLGLGLGWTNAVKRGRDVTQRFLAGTGGRPGVSNGVGAVAPDLSARLRERILGRLAAGPLRLGEAVGLTGELLAGHRVSERIATTESAVWEMLHAGTLALHPRAGAAPLPRDQWEAVVLDPDAWLASGPDSPVISATA